MTSQRPWPSRGRLARGRERTRRERGEETERFHEVASRLVLAAIVPVALALSADLAVVVWKLFGSAALAGAFGAGAAAMFLGTWFGSSWGARARRRRAKARV